MLVAQNSLGPVCPVPLTVRGIGSGAPAEGHCDLCQTDLRPGRADIDHVIFECGHAELAAVRDRWTAAASIPW